MMARRRSWTSDTDFPNHVKGLLWILKKERNCCDNTLAGWDFYMCADCNQQLMRRANQNVQLSSSPQVDRLANTKLWLANTDLHRHNNTSIYRRRANRWITAQLCSLLTSIFDVIYVFETSVAISGAIPVKPVVWRSLERPAFRRCNFHRNVIYNKFITLSSLGDPWSNEFIVLDTQWAFTYPAPSTQMSSSDILYAYIWNMFSTQWPEPSWMLVVSIQGDALARRWRTKGVVGETICSESWPRFKLTIPHFKACIS